MDSELLMLGAVVVGLAVIGLIPAAIAYSKGWNFLTWWAWGALMFPYALVAALTMQRNEETMEARALAAGMVKCPFCGEMIWNEAEVCRHCGRDLAPGAGEEEEESSAPAMEAEELVRRYGSGERDFGLANLSGTALSGANLAEISLSGADLSRADLSGANLRQADLQGTDLFQANLSGANLRGADLGEADLSEANLSGADLRGAELSGANLTRSTLADSTRIDAKWQLVWSILNEPAAKRDLQRADLSGAYLRDAELRRADLRGADLSGADLRGASLGGAYLDEANLHGAKVTHQQVAGVQTLQGATMPDGTVVE